MPETGVRTPIRIREDAGMWRVVLAKRIAVEVIVVNPRGQSVSLRRGKGEGGGKDGRGKRRTVGEEEPSSEVLESVPQPLNLSPPKHPTQPLPSSHNLPPRAPLPLPSLSLSLLFAPFPFPPILLLSSPPTSTHTRSLTPIRIRGDTPIRQPTPRRHTPHSPPNPTHPNSKPQSKRRAMQERHGHQRDE